MNVKYHDLSRFKYLDIKDRKPRIYRICDDKTVIYIGCTVVSVYNRLMNHVNDSYTLAFDKKKGSLIRSALKKDTLKVDILYEFSDRKTAEIVEKHLIHYLSSNSSITHDLFNVAARNTVTDKVFYKNTNIKNGRGR